MPLHAVATTAAISFPPPYSRFLSPSQHHRHLHFPAIITAQFSHGIINTKTLQFSASKRRRFDTEAVDSSSESSPSAATAGKSIFSDDQFSLAKISFGVMGLGSGVTLLTYGFGAYFNILPGSEWSALMLTYGFPVAVIGMPLKYAELKPVPCVTYSDAQLLTAKCANPVLKQVKTDVTRYRYGDEQHLVEALKRIFQYGQVTEDGKYCLVLVFEGKSLQLSDFKQRQGRKPKFAVVFFL